MMNLLFFFFVYFSNANSRGLPSNNFLPSQFDSISQSDSGFEQSHSPSVILKQRAIINNNNNNNRSSHSPTILQSNSVNGITNPSSEYVNNSPLTSIKQSRSLFEGVPDEYNDYTFDDQPPNDRSSSAGDRQSMSSPEKTRKQILPTKILKSFQNIRFRKKNSNS